ncbi:MAG: hypothetical protein AAFT19_00115 [Pseudomonadota bacterium]
MGDGIAGGANANVLTTARDMDQSNILGSMDDEGTVRETDKQGVYGQDLSPWPGIKDFFRKMFHPQAHAQHLQQRDAKIQRGAQNIFEAFRGTHGDKIAVNAFKAVGSSVATTSSDRTVTYQATNVTGGQLGQLMNIAQNLDKHL